MICILSPDFVRVRSFRCRPVPGTFTPVAVWHLQNPSWWRKYFYVHFTKGETEAQRGALTGILSSAEGMGACCPASLPARLSVPPGVPGGL